MTDGIFERWPDPDAPNVCVKTATPRADASRVGGSGTHRRVTDDESRSVKTSLIRIAGARRRWRRSRSKWIRVRDSRQSNRVWAAVADRVIQKVDRRLKSVMQVPDI